MIIINGMIQTLCKCCGQFCGHTPVCMSLECWIFTLTLVSLMASTGRMLNRKEGDENYLLSYLSQLRNSFTSQLMRLCLHNISHQKILIKLWNLLFSNEGIQEGTFSTVVLSKDTNADVLLPQHIHGLFYDLPLGFWHNTIPILRMKGLHNSTDRLSMWYIVLCAYIFPQIILLSYILHRFA